jgi:type IV pilus assembly protein PilC
LVEFSFHYQARNLDGEAVSGRVEAETRQAALGLLRSRNLFVVKISQARAGKRRLSVPRGRVRVKELAIFCRQFAVMNAA